jgi:hypothetical protein
MILQSSALKIGHPSLYSSRTRSESSRFLPLRVPQCVFDDRVTHYVVIQVFAVLNVHVFAKGAARELGPVGDTENVFNTKSNAVAESVCGVLPMPVAR